MREILGKPMIMHVYERVKRSEVLDEVYVAADSEEVLGLCKRNGFFCVMTGKCQRGLDRVIEASGKIGGDLYVNIQADEPLIDLGMIRKVVEPYWGVGGFGGVSTLSYKCEGGDGGGDRKDDINVVKVVKGKGGRALYFSRLGVPYGGRSYEEHIGLYGYPGRVLEEVRGKEGELERLEDLEQLRFLEYGVEVRVLESRVRTLGVDTKEDLERVERILKERTLKKDIEKGY